jgi:hypothetical protein
MSRTSPWPYLAVFCVLEFVFVYAGASCVVPMLFAAT